MKFSRKSLYLAMAVAMPFFNSVAHADDHQDQIDALRAELAALQQKVDEVAGADNTELLQKVTKVEQKQDQSIEDAEKSGLKGLKFSGVVEASYKIDSLSKTHSFGSSAGLADEYAMIQISKESQDGKGVDWMLRLLPGATSLNHVHEASVSIPIDRTTRVIGGLIPDFQGYEANFGNATPALGNQLITHNALFDAAGATSYTGIGASHTWNSGAYALKWLVGNIDPASDSLDAPTSVGASMTKTVGFAARADWSISEFASVGAAYLHGSVNRNFDIMDVDGAYVHGNWQFNGQITLGQQRNAAANGDDAKWLGLSAFASYKLNPRLQLISRADYISNKTNGGGTYAFNGGSAALGLGPEMDSDGVVVDGNTGADLARLTFGTTFQINPNTQWKAEYRLDSSSGYNFVDSDLLPAKTRQSMSTSLLVSF
jgi:hypothetical protein